jgi:hypothetical protein
MEIGKIEMEVFLLRILANQKFIRPAPYGAPTPAAYGTPLDTPRYAPTPAGYPETPAGYAQTPAAYDDDPRYE